MPSADGLSHHLVPHAARIDARLADRWKARGDTYAELQRQFRSISGLLGTGGGAAAAEGAHAVARLRALPADIVVEPRVLGGFQLLFDRLDRWMGDVVEEGITQGAFAQRVSAPRPAEEDDIAATARDQLIPVGPSHHRDLIGMVRSLLPHEHQPPATPGPARADLHSALVHRTATRSPGPAPRF